jgi:hypothetical protein
MKDATKMGHAIMLIAFTSLSIRISTEIRRAVVLLLVRKLPSTKARWFPVIGI